MPKCCWKNLLHCSDSLTSDVLKAIKSQGGYVTSIHPMKSFSDPRISVENYTNTFFVIEGDADALKVISPWFTSFGSIVYTINKENKSLYHAAGVFTSNYLITIAHQAFQMPNGCRRK